jgi:hypothetical protein
MATVKRGASKKAKKTPEPSQAETGIDFDSEKSHRQKSQGRRTEKSHRSKNRGKNQRDIEAHESHWQSAQT